MGALKGPVPHSKRKINYEVEKIALTVSVELAAAIRKAGVDLTKERGRNIYMNEIVEDLLRADFGMAPLER